MVHGDVDGVFVGAVIPHLGNVLQQLFPLHRVGFHDLELLGREPAGLIQNGVRDGDLAHVVHHRRQRDVLHGLLAEPLAQLGAGEQLPGDALQPAHMVAGLAAAELDGRRQRSDHAVAQLDDPAGLGQQGILLALHHAVQPPPGPEQLHHAAHPALHQIGHHRLADHVHHAQAVGLLLHVVAGLGGDHEHRHLTGDALLMQPAQHLEAVHFGHHHVQQHGAQPPRICQNTFQPLAAVFRLLDAVLPGKYIFQNRPDHLVVVHDEKGLRRCGICLRHS